MSRALLTLLVLACAAGPASAQTGGRALVVPFESVRTEPRFQWLSEASAVLLTDGLRERGRDAITRTERVSAFEQLHLPVAASLSRATVIKVGQLLGAGDVVVGSFTVDGDQLTVTAHTIRVDVGRLQPAATERGELTQLFDIFERLAGRLAREGGSHASNRRAEPPPLDAFENFIKGLVAENPGTKASFLETAVREHPQFDRARLALWSVRSDQGDHDAALATVRAVPASSPLARRARFAGGVSLLELKRYDEAFVAFTSIADENGGGDAATLAAALNNLGVIQIRRGSTPQTGTATYFLTRAVDSDTDPDYLFNLGYAYVLEDNHQGAIYWLREALRRDPTDADAHFVLAAALQTTGSAVEASRERDLAGQLSARYESLARQSGHDKPPTGLERVALEPEASRALRADLTIATSTQREHRELARFHLERGRRLFEKEQDREAMAELRRTVYLSPYEAEAHLLIGRIHLRAGLPGDAIDALKISIWSEDTAAARLTLAQAYLKAGNSASARAEAERAIALDPASDEAKRLLASIR